VLDQISLFAVNKASKKKKKKKKKKKNKTKKKKKKKKKKRPKKKIQHIKDWFNLLKKKYLDI